MKEIIYQILPRLWKNGKFSGIDADSLSYFKSLSADYIWYTGIIRHATRPLQKVVKGEIGSPYAITDYYDVNPYLADDPSTRMSEFEDLVKRTHEEGLKVIIDFVPNHVAREYNGALTPKGDEPLGAQDNTSVHWSRDNDFFYYPGESLSLPVGADVYTEFPAKATGNCFSPFPGINDWYETVKINYCDFHTRTWDKMYRIVRFWAQKGVDGFRCDMVELVPPQFFKWLITSIKSEFPSVKFIAEVYEKEKYSFYIWEVGFDLLYDKSGLYDTLRAVSCIGLTARSITWNWQMLGSAQPHMLNFLENHDEQRLASAFFLGSAVRARAALSVSLLLNSAPFMLYFGQETGERGGEDGRTTIFNRWKYAPQKGSESILEGYREILALSKKPVFARGLTYDLCYCQDGAFDPEHNFAFLRSYEGETFLVVANFADARDITVRIPPEALSFLGVKAVRSVYTLEVGALDYALVKIQ